jgi:protein SCO1/2
MQHATRAEVTAHPDATGAAQAFPIEITPRFRLIDQSGRTVTEADFTGRPMVIFFGYANCESICSVALPRMGAALDMLGGRAEEITPIMITVDPARDTPEALARKLPQHHLRLIGLTGDEAALAAARAAFQVEAHGSFIYLVGRDGLVRSVLPPVLGPEHIAALIRKHL